MTYSHAQSRALATRLFLSMLATQELLTIYIGVRLGLYEELARMDGATATQFAERARISPRYAREWLEQQAVAGFLTVDDARKLAEERVYSLPSEHGEVLRVSDSQLSVVSLTVLPVGAVARVLPLLLDAYRSNSGIPDTEFGEDWRDGHSGTNRAFFVHLLAPSIKRLLTDVEQRLNSQRARIADIGCGTGWASISLAKAYPQASVDGFDLNQDVIEIARKNAVAEGVSERVNFEVRDGASLSAHGCFDLVCVFDTLHEMAHPVDVLRTCRALRAPGGSVLVMDAKVADHFVAPGDEIERFQYATSLLHCLPVSLAEQFSAATGTVMRVSIVQDYAAQAGFNAVEIVPLDDRFHRLYRLVG